LALLIIVLTALIGIAFWHFDLDNYNETLASKMSSVLQQPVSIGSSKLAFHNGLAIEFHQLNITGHGRIRASIPKVAVTLDLLPLLHGQFLLKDVRLIEPQLELTLTDDSSSAQENSHKLLSSLGIDTLSVYNASLLINNKKTHVNTWDNLRVDQLTAVLHGWQTDTSCLLTLVASLPDYGADISLNTTLPFLTLADDWRQQRFHGRLKLIHLSREKRPELTSNIRLPQTFDLEVNFDGVPAETVPISLKLFASASDNPLATLSAHWTASKTTQDIDNIEGQLFAVPVNGEVHLSHDETNYHLYGRLDVTSFDLTSPQFRYWQPPLSKKLSAGHINYLHASFANNWQKSKPFSGLPPLSLSLSAEGLKWGDSPLQQLPQLTTEVLLNGETLDIREGHIVTPTGDNVTITGSIKNLLSAPDLAINADGEITLEPLLQQFQLPERWTVNGNIPLQAKLTGPLQNTKLELTANLNQTAIKINNIVEKTVGHPASLRLTTHQSYDQVSIDQVTLNLGDLQVDAHGTLELAEKKKTFELSILPLDLEKLGTYSPLLQKRQIKGKLSAQLSQSKNDLRSHITISEGSAYLTKIMGELNKVSGSFLLNREGMKFSKVKASLGESAFLADGGIASWQQPQLKLDLKGAEVRAHDLFFRDRTLTLYDLTGSLLIDAQGIRFAPVRLRVEDDTLVTVTGELKSFREPQVLLNVQADKANVKNVIDLFTGPAKGTSQKGQNKKPYVRIHSTIKTGTLGDLRFKNATGIISYSSGLLDISPLHFENGNGHCDGRVIYDNSDKRAPLKVSGHIEDIDAQVFHRDFFKKPGLISGQLYADFYLEGQPKTGFWKQARGGINLQVHDGVLNKFNALSKVFSLLNVSQLFTLKFPDLKTEGMPFSLLEGSLRIADGYMHTEDLAVTSEAMNLSLIGSQKLEDNSLDFVLGVMPLRTVDKIITSIPIAGWVLTGDNKALLTAYFKIEGEGDNPQVSAIPINSLSDSVFGILKRTLQLPGKLIKDIGSVVKDSQPIEEE
jgi:uncharacterized protein involved in outer membrane biogenesis